METQCLNEAAYRFTWPGEEESFICIKHISQLLGVANALSLPLQTILIDGTEFEGAKCQQKIPHR